MPASGEDFTQRQAGGDSVQLLVVSHDVDHLKAHQFGGALHERRIALFEPRGMRLAVNIDAKHHENRYFFAHSNTCRGAVFTMPQRRTHSARSVNIHGTQ